MSQAEFEIYIPAPQEEVRVNFECGSTTVDPQVCALGGLCEVGGYCVEQKRPDIAARVRDREQMIARANFQAGREHEARDPMLGLFGFGSPLGIERSRAFIVNGLADKQEMDAVEGDRRHRPNAFIMEFYDVNGLSYVNDTFGHINGDVLLRFISECVRTRAFEDECYRRGGDEMIVLKRHHFDPSEYGAGGLAAGIAAYQQELEVRTETMVRERWEYHKSKGSEDPFYPIICLVDQGLPFPMVAAGSHIVLMDDIWPREDQDYAATVIGTLTQMADAAMYKHKERLKQASGFYRNRCAKGVCRLAGLPE